MELIFVTFRVGEEYVIFITKWKDWRESEKFCEFGDGNSGDVPELQAFDSQCINFLSNVSYSHLIELIKIESPMKRLFNLEQPRNSFPDLIRDPYNFEFVGLKQPEVLPEKRLEQALLDHL